MSSERAEADTVSLEVSEGIAWVRFNRPEKRNCMSPKLNRQMRRIIEDVEFRDDVRVLVLAGAGEAWLSLLEPQHAGEPAASSAQPPAKPISIEANWPAGGGGAYCPFWPAWAPPG